MARISYERVRRQAR